MNDGMDSSFVEKDFANWIFFANFLMFPFLLDSNAAFDKINCGLYQFQKSENGIL